MAEETTGTAAVAETTATATAAPAPAPIINPDGTFTEKWRDSLPEEIRGEKCLDTVTDFPNAIKQLVHHKKMVGANKVALPTEKSTPAEWDAFYAAVGRPQTEGDYQAEIPEDMKSLYTDERLAAIRKRAFTAGATQKQFATFLQEDLAASSQLLQDLDQAEQRQKDEDVLALKKEFGAAYDERMHVANRLIAETFGNNETGKLAFLAKYGADPDMVRFASAVGAKMVEHKGLIAQLTTNTPGEALAKINELRATKGYLQMSSEMPREERDGITAKIREYTKQAYPEPAPARA
jgi:hypothetical protein